MPEFSGKRKSRRRQLNASHQKNWLIGRYAVLETLRAGRWTVEELYADDRLQEPVASEVIQLAATIGITPQKVTAERLTELCHADHHQGLIARMGIFPYDDISDLTEKLTQQQQHGARHPIVVICDRIQDTYNFGSVLRCCDAMAVTAVVIGSPEQALVSPQVSRSAAGAVNHLSVVLTDDLTESVLHLKRCGLTVAAATEKSASVAWEEDLNRPMALIVGSEARGISKELLDACDVSLRIPMEGQVESLNAAVASGILLYEIRRQQNSV